MNNASNIESKEGNKFAQRIVGFARVASATAHAQILCRVFAAACYWNNVVKCQVKAFRLFSANIAAPIVTFDDFQTVNFFIRNLLDFRAAFTGKFGAFVRIGFQIAIHRSRLSAFPNGRLFAGKCFAQILRLALSRAKAAGFGFDRFYAVIFIANFAGFNNRRMDCILHTSCGAIQSSRFSRANLFSFIADYANHKMRGLLSEHLALS